MNFEFSEEQELLREQARGFLDRALSAGGSARGARGRRRLRRRALAKNRRDGLDCHGHSRGIWRARPLLP